MRSFFALGKCLNTALDFASKYLIEIEAVKSNSSRSLIRPHATFVHWGY